MSKPTFHPYTAWEDWKAGMWRLPSNVDAEIARAVEILSDCDQLRPAARAMLTAWPTSAEHNLTGAQQNPRAWVGQATCCHRAGVTESATRAAWWTLTVAQRDAANRAVDDVIAEWEASRNDQPGLFPLSREGGTTSA